jgi:hypothetical protein
LKVSPHYVGAGRCSPVGKIRALKTDDNNSEDHDSILSAITHKLNVSGHMLIRTFFLILMSGTHIQSFSSFVTPCRYGAYEVQNFLHLECTGVGTLLVPTLTPLLST